MELFILCSECKSQLTIKEIGKRTSYLNDINIEVEPCKTCLKEKYNEGFSGGKEAGIEEEAAEHES